MFASQSSMQPSKVYANKKICASQRKKALAGKATLEVHYTKLHAKCLMFYHLKWLSQGSLKVHVKEQVLKMKCKSASPFVGVTREVPMAYVSQRSLSK